MTLHVHDDNCKREGCQNNPLIAHSEKLLKLLHKSFCDYMEKNDIGVGMEGSIFVNVFTNLVSDFVYNAYGLERGKKLLKDFEVRCQAVILEHHGIATRQKTSKHH